MSLTVVFAVVSSFFGLWQWDRREQAVAAITKLETNWDQTPVPMASLGNQQDFSADLAQWTPVVVSGVYAVEDQLLVRTRPRGGQVGFEVVVPFRTGEGTVVMVNRGWVPTGEATDFPDVLPLAPRGEISVFGRIKPGEPTLVGRGAPEGQIPSIDLPTIERLLGYEIEQKFYVLLASESPAPSTAPLPGLRPVLDEGPHLSYTLQWFVFALLAFIAFFSLLRQEAQREAGVVPAAPRKRSDADEEDALLDEVRA